jgi:diaminohydroxyphosphoribosylaminopyrimidine deaminase / 5-amino-6-(5-phosphoribosylamino)uracil reductase
VDHSNESLDRQFMGEALRLAARIPRRPWPNPPVGAVVVRGGQILGRGAHHGAGTDHAEAVALREAGGLARGATLYCTLEPCNHQGRTPPCAPAVVAAGIRRAVVAIHDPNPAVRGGGLRHLRNAGIEVCAGVMGAEALDAAWPFVTTRAFERPFVILKTATSLDGYFAPLHSHEPGAAPFYLTGIEARHDVHRLRRWCDVVLVGEGTIAADRPRLDGRLVTDDDDCPASDPTPAYVDTDLSLDGGWSRSFWVFAGEAATRSLAGRIQEHGGRVIACDSDGGHVTPASVVARFREQGGHVLMVEGGPTLAASFLRAGLVDRWVTYVAPVVLGSGVRWPESSARATFHTTRVTTVGPDVKVVFDRLPFDQLLTAVAADPGMR